MCARTFGMRHVLRVNLKHAISRIKTFLNEQPHNQKWTVETKYPNRMQRKNLIRSGKKHTRDQREKNKLMQKDQREKETQWATLAKERKKNIYQLGEKHKNSPEKSNSLPTCKNSTIE